MKLGINDEIWTIVKNKKDDFLPTLLTISIGIILYIIYYINQNKSEQIIYLMWTSFIFIFLGIGIYLWDEEIITTIDPQRNRLQIKSTNRISSHLFNIPFSEISDVHIHTLNRYRSGAVKIHSLKIRLKNNDLHRIGKSSLNQAELIILGEKLASTIGCPIDYESPNNSINPKYIPFAMIGSIGIYSIWYRLSVGPWCPAMWAGTAPLVIILFGFYFLIRIGKNFS